MISFRREDCIDAEVNASGLMKQMQKDLLKELNITIDVENEGNSETETYKDCINNIEDLKDQMNNLQFKSEISQKEESTVLRSNKDQINNLQLESKKEKSTVFTCNVITKDNNECFEKMSTTICSEQENNENIENIIDKECSNVLYDLSSKTVEDKAAYISDCDDIESIRSVSTATTIAPEVIKKKVKIALDNREKKNQSKRKLVKGEASAVTRIRRENRATVKESLTGIWGLE